MSITRSTPNSRTDANNTNTGTLAAGQTWTGGWADLDGFVQVITTFSATQPAEYSIEFSTDGITGDGPRGPYVLAANTTQAQSFAHVRRYYRVAVTNTSGSTAILTIETTLFAVPPLVKARIGDKVLPNASADTTRAFLFGRTEGGGVIKPASIAEEGHLETEVKGQSIDSFGNVTTTSPAAVIQLQQFGQTGVNSELHATYTRGSGTFAQGTGQQKTQLIASTGATPGSVAMGGSRRRVNYRAAQGVRPMYTARFSAPTSGCVAWVGLGDARDGLAIGCNGFDENGIAATPYFGIRHWRFGQFEIRRLEITTASAGAETVTITLNGVATAFGVANASANKMVTANNIAAQPWGAVGSGWDVYTYLDGVTTYVVFVSRTAEPLTGTYSMASTGTAAGTFTRWTAGLAPVETWIRQAEWNNDVADGSSTPEVPDEANPSGFELVPTNLNVFKSNIQYLGAGNVRTSIENNVNGQFFLAHAIEFAGQFDVTSFGNMSLPMMCYASNGATSTSMQAATASMAAFVEGDIKRTGPQDNVGNPRTGVGAAETCILLIQNPLILPSGEPNTASLLILGYDLTNTGGNAQAVWRVLRNPTLGTGAAATASFAPKALGKTPALINTTFTTGATGSDEVEPTMYQPPNTTTQRNFEQSLATAGRIFPGETFGWFASTTGSNIAPSVSVRYVWDT